MTPVCAEHAETFWTLVTNLAHWELELFIMLVFDVLVGAIAWPFVKKHWAHHLKHDEAHPETTPTPGIAAYDLDHDAKMEKVVRAVLAAIDARKVRP